MTSGSIVKETIDSSSPPSPLDEELENQLIGVANDVIGWQSIFADLPQATMILNGQQQVLFANTALTLLTGDNPTKIEGGIEGWLRLLCPDPNQANRLISSWHENIWRSQLTRVFDLMCKGSPRQIEFRSTKGKDGHLSLIHI